jgi:hypothetical protein
MKAKDKLNYLDLPKLSHKEHREIGTLIRALDRKLQRSARAHDNKPLAAQAELVSDLRSALDDSWLAHHADHCHPDHSPYYGDRWCSMCAGGEEAKAKATEETPGKKP